MEILEPSKFYLFIFFILPGFISVKTYQLFYPSSAKDAKDLIIDTLVYSCINYGILGLPIYYTYKNLINSFSVFDIYLTLIFIFALFPILWVILWRKIRESTWLQHIVPHPTALPWDYIFRKRECYWVTITLKNGMAIGGLYGENSFASNSPSQPEIFLEERWILDEDGNLERKVNNTSGIWIKSDDISHMEFNKVEK